MGICTIVLHSISFLCLMCWTVARFGIVKLLMSPVSDGMLRINEFVTGLSLERKQQEKSFISLILISIGGMSLPRQIQVLCW